MKSSISNYFFNGLSLANKSLDIFLISLLLVLVGFIPLFLGDSLISNVLLFVNFFLLFIHFGFIMSIPLFLVDKQHNESINYHHMWSVTLRNSKRMILPVILLLILTVVVGFSFLFITAFNVAQSGGDLKQIVTSIQSLANPVQGWNPVVLVFTSLFSFLIFTPIYFSIENKGFLSSIKRSIIFSFKNLNFIVVVILIGTISYSLSALIPIPLENKIGWAVRTILGEYIGFIMTASSLLYYQSKNGKESN